MPKKEQDRSLRHHWGPGDIQFEVSQCAYCENNQSAYECLVFDIKPDEYFDNKTKCPKKIPEKEPTAINEKEGR